MRARHRYHARLPRVAAGLLVTSLVAAAVVAPALAKSTHPVTRSQVVSAAARRGAHDGYTVGLAVLDRRTDKLYTAGHARSQFATESVVKVLIAARILVQHRMHGAVAKTAYKMITQSDDASATRLYGSVGADGLMTWTKKHFHESDLGRGPHRAGWWGATRITPVGLVRLYAKLAANKTVGPWLLNAMHHAHHYGSDGTYQYFGIASASKHAAIKQGWGCEYTSGCNESDFNSTGFVNSDRYAVAVLARGPMSRYGTRISRELTTLAKIVLPHGAFPPPAPVLSRLSHITTHLGGGESVTIHGTDLTGARSVHFGTTPAAIVTRLSRGALRVRVPRHTAGAVYVYVTTAYGTSRATRHARLTYRP